MDVMTAFQQSFPYVAGVELGRGNELRIGTLNSPSGRRVDATRILFKRET